MNDLRGRTYSHFGSTGAKTPIQRDLFGKSFMESPWEEEATWEVEDDMRRLYPYIFQKGTFSCFKNSRTNFLKGENCKTLMFMRLYMVSKIEM